VFDECGKIVFSEINKSRRQFIRNHHDVEKLYNATSGDQLYKCNDEDTGYSVCVECVCAFTCISVCVCVCVQVFVRV